MTRFRQFGAITKVEDQEDGTIKVWGVASSETRDQQGETITAAAMKAALPDYGRFPALREMHEPSAAGRVVEAEVDDHGITQICAHVVDPLAITKVRAGVYAGFAIGGKVLKRDTADRSVGFPGPQRGIGTQAQGGSGGSHGSGAGGSSSADLPSSSTI